MSVTWTDDPLLPADEVLRRADTAMYQSKLVQGRHPVLWRPDAPAPMAS